mmetsp:Transcript_17761/g.32135  ORF Transcript_17761/g.32135 Transcript_17761/m.32135 type:complete len:204 (+) Transcript_17761:697-1308(+)
MMSMSMPNFDFHAIPSSIGPPWASPCSRDPTIPKFPWKHSVTVVAPIVPCEMHCWNWSRHPVPNERDPCANDVPGMWPMSCPAPCPVSLCSNSTTTTATQMKTPIQQLSYPFMNDWTIPNTKTPNLSSHPMTRKSGLWPRGILPQGKLLLATIILHQDWTGTHPREPFDSCYNLVCLPMFGQAHEKWIFSSNWVFYSIHVYHA